MAYKPEMLKAMGGGAGLAPRVFTYSTEDLIADIGALGYFKDAVAIFEPQDIVLAHYARGGANLFTILICVESTKVDGGEHLVDFSGYATFGGDVRANDVPGYQSSNMSVIVDGGKPDELFRPYTYRNNSDNVSVIGSADYFKEAGLFLEVGDLIYIIGNDAFSLRRVATTGIGGVTTTTAMVA